MGSGDWNDGMNRVGAGGHGESVWLAWFLIAALESFAPVAEARGDQARVQRWREHVARLRTAAEAEAWDGAWYRRAFFDDGEPLGSAASAECCIDSIAQSWAVISGAADPERARRAMDAVQEYLVRRGDDLVLLFTPPFDRSAQDPGYVKAYPPGIRENGGQYTHAAVWCAIALAELGEGGSCAELLRMLNPAHRAATRAGVHAYKVEPYVLAADIYSEPPHTRRGGWTWYTGAAGWFHRAAVEWLLGFRVRAGHLELDPRIPKDWPGYAVRYRLGAAVYEVTVENPQGAGRGIALLELDGVPQPGPRLALRGDGKVHRVRAVLG
jgi:cyclic beta-1,2-glucan synthetase